MHVQHTDPRALLSCCSGCFVCVCGLVIKNSSECLGCKLQPNELVRCSESYRFPPPVETSEEGIVSFTAFLKRWPTHTPTTLQHIVVMTHLDNVLERENGLQESVGLPEQKDVGVREQHLCEWRGRARNSLQAVTASWCWTLYTWFKSWAYDSVCLGEVCITQQHFEGQ